MPSTQPFISYVAEAIMSEESKGTDDNPVQEHFADYFVVCGLDELDGLERHDLSVSDITSLSPLQLCYKSSILWHFPESNIYNVFEADAIKLLSMPRGVYLKKRPNSRKFHSFMQTKEDGTKIYGFVLTFYEKVINEKILSAMETLFKMYNTELFMNYSENQNSPNRSFINTNNNGYKNNISHSYYSKNSDELYVSRCICLITRKPFVTIAQQCLEDILTVGMNEVNFNYRLESYIYNVLYEIPLPPSGRTMRYVSINGDPIVVQNPHLNEIPYFDYSMKEVVMTLGFENLVDLFTCMLLEHQILFLSNDLSKLMLLAESLTTLFFPLLWQHVYVPVLPPSLLHFLDAPVPFIMGLYYSTEEEKERLQILEGSLCLLDINTNDLLLPQDIPELPWRGELINELRDIANKYGIFPSEGSVRLRNELDETDEDDSCECPVDVYDSTYNSSKIYTSRGVGTWPRKKTNAGRKRTSQSPLINPKNVNVSTYISPQNVRKKMVASNWAGESTPQIHRETDRNLWKNNNKKSLEAINANSRLAKIISIAERAGINTGINEKSTENLHEILNPLTSKDDLFVMSTRALTVKRKQQHESEFNIVIQELFVNCFTQMLLDYENFVILPQQTKEEWLHNREHMQNFDKASFLSDQSQLNLAFMTLFVETQGFASLIDMKIMALWEDCDPKLAYFDKRIDKLKVDLGPSRNPSYEKCTSIPLAIESYIQRCSHIDHDAIQPHSLKLPIKREMSCGYFPIPDKAALLETKKKKPGKINWKRRDKLQQQHEHNILNEALKSCNCDGQKNKEKLADRLKKYMQETKMITKDSPTPGVSQKTLHAFGEKLLKECMVKTKRLVVLKLGQEAVELGHSGPNTAGIEENTLIASICDLLERVWSHGVQLKQLEFGKESAKSKFVQRMRQSKSALWSHLLAFYHKQITSLEAVYGLTNTDNITADVRQLLLTEIPRSPQRKTSTVDILSGNISRMMRNISVDSDNESSYPETEKYTEDQGSLSLPYTPSTPTIEPKHQRHQETFDKLAFLDNLKTILQMKEIKTDTGYARAWTRLALEKKVLAKDLRLLLTRKKLLTTRYKEYAFIRTEDEMEQFLYHLLSLNAVDFFCFTNGYPTSHIIYKVQVIIGKHIGSFTTANCWMNITGSLGNTSIINTPKGELEFQFKHKNLGILNALRIGHDSSGISPGWFIEFVAITNEITGHLYRFQCHRWLAKGQDDGSTERLLIAEVMDQKRKNGRRPKSTLCLGISDKPEESTPTLTSNRNMSSIFSKKLSTSDIQEKVADAVNNMVKYFFKDSGENMTLLLCGEGGFCQAIELVFRHGFKSNRLFGKNLFIWDYLEKVSDELFNMKFADKSSEKMFKKCYQDIVTQINEASLSIGKDQKFQLFICLGLRERYLQQWFRLLQISPVTVSLYESYSFFRDSCLLDFLVGVLEALTEFDVVLDESITRGI